MSEIEYPISNPSVIKEKEDFTGQARNNECRRKGKENIQYRTPV